MPAPRPIAEPRQIVVEGSDAEAFFKALLRAMGLGGMQVQNFGGKDELRGFLKALSKSSGFRGQVVSLGIIRDAETNPASAFQSVCDALRHVGLTAPHNPESLEGSGPQVAVLILPNATTAGMLETICLQAVADHPAMQCVHDYFDCVNRRLGLLPNNMPKARVQAFLASRPKPGLRLGEAAEAGYWDWDNPVFDHVKRFLRTL